MNPCTISTVVEGHGEVDAVPVLLRRLAQAIAPDRWIDLPRPRREGRGLLLRPGGIERAAEVAAVRGGPRSILLVLLDADDDCPAKLAPRLLDRIQTARPDREAVPSRVAGRRNKLPLFRPNSRKPRDGVGAGRQSVPRDSAVASM